MLTNPALARDLTEPLKQHLRALAPGLAPRAVLEKLSAMRMVGVHLPTSDGRHIVLPRHTQPDRDQRLLLQRLKLPCRPSYHPASPPPPKTRPLRPPPFSADLLRSTPTIPIP